MVTPAFQPTSKRWLISPLIPPGISSALEEFPSLLRQLLYNRGITDYASARAFVDCQPATQTNPFLMKDMLTAVEILHQALDEGAPIAIYGDYDVDGVTSSALLYEFLSRLGNTPRVYIPSRFDEGYGLNLDAVAQLNQEGISLLITVDCGIRSIPEIALAKSLGMRVILSDHHQPGAELPPADAVINTRQAGDPYPYKQLAGVGLAFKLADAYLRKFPQQGLDAQDWLDLVALGTVADLAPINGENRALVRAGLDQMRATRRQGLYSLAQVSGIKLESVNSGNIGFGLGPRLNAAGRLDSAMAAFELLTSTDIFSAGMLAQQLDAQNAQRKDLTLRIQEQAIQSALQADPDSPVIFAASPDFNEGVVGLAASRVAEQLYRPAIIGAQGETTIVASCRSIPEFNITSALDACADLLVRYGGHSMAAGLTVSLEKAPELLARLNAIARETLQGVELVPVLGIDREIRLEHLRPEFVPQVFEAMEKLEPTGRENPEALFCSRGLLVVNARTVGDGQHLKLTLQAGRNSFDAIAFKQGYWLDQLSDNIDIAYAFELNSYMGRNTLQLNVKDIHPAQT
ncbi:MAG: single-stranded-DNA-specific exonuclease RecJ [Anaerolineaceae bacterium]